MTTKLLCFTDLHIRRPGETIIGLDPIAKFRGALDHALRRHPDAARVVLMGDLANSGRAEEYAALRAVLQGCPLPVTLMPGNHDDRDALCAGLGAARDADGFIQSSLDTESHRVLFLDTVFGTRYLSFASLGQYDAPRLNWLKAQLDTDRPVLIFAHHPPMKTGFPGMDDIRLRDDAALAEAIRGSTVRHLICGHVHRSISGSWQGCGFTILKSTCHQSPLAFDSHELSLSTPEPAAYGIVLLSDEGIVVHSEDWELASDEYVNSDDAVALD